jgi:ABC-type uncharacterized transport system substrate-binding protein
VDLVASLNRPGGNVTGVASLTGELAAKRVELLHQLLPAAAVVGLLVNPTNPVTEQETRGALEAARAFGLLLHILPASSANDIDTALASLVELRADALVIGVDPFLTNQRAQILAFAAQQAMPAIYGWREFVAAGGLMSYGTDISDSYRQVGIYTGKILQGAKPTDLPVQQSVRVNLVINLNTAKRLGLTIPAMLFARADEVIE